MMSRIRFISALVVSIALIGGALWFRFIKNPQYSTQVFTAPDFEQISSEDEFLKNFFSASSTISVASTSTPSETEVIAKQIFSEYITLKSKGEVTSESLNKLADKYANSILNLNIQISKATLNQLIVLPDTETNLNIYGIAITNIRSKYKSLIATQYTGKNISDINSPEFSNFMDSASKLYKASAKELLTIKVPTSLAQNHLGLINNHLENSEIMKMISETFEDPTQAYAALNLYVQNTEKEKELLLKIQTTLMASGIIFNSNI